MDKDISWNRVLIVMKKFDKNGYWLINSESLSNMSTRDIKQLARHLFDEYYPEIDYLVSQEYIKSHGSGYFLNTKGKIWKNKWIKGRPLWLTKIQFVLFDYPLLGSIVGGVVGGILLQLTILIIENIFKS